MAMPEGLNEDERMEYAHGVDAGYNVAHYRWAVEVIEPLGDRHHAEFIAYEADKNVMGRRNERSSVAAAAYMAGFVDGWGHFDAKCNPDGSPWDETAMNQTPADARKAL